MRDTGNYIIFFAKTTINLQATRLFIVTSTTKGGWLPAPLDLVLGSRYCIV